MTPEEQKNILIDHFSNMLDGRLLPDYQEKEWHHKMDQFAIDYDLLAMVRRQYPTETFSCDGGLLFCITPTRPIRSIPVAKVIHDATEFTRWMDSL